ncbi:glycine N-phenylacetyltransferase-like isoform X1 [Mustela nigripes]|uniref:glycine N-phenylacetyltransferase-like isoform X1 n=1 Tax=Mustela nigripes TaxID=77151 RepID=UPI002816490A|nr:glycine N-phenylacetyltransferase-like isoform X1 [Mustela nigripes]XP_059260975.1 glycine N-phenylacetyltransferase-like isoform X1 [Mustela nigripes]XP_059260979.1 glycine N-phenylacetyltransferase-like isoform X1 [Mustela nigripes]
MFHLQGPQVLQMLEKSLRKSLPESLKVYGTVFHMNQRNPFKLTAMVDKWPDFTTVVIRPQEEEMTDDFDYYTNTYQIYSKNPPNCQEFLGASGVINWKQRLQIQSSQSSLNEVIQNLAAVKLVKVEQQQGIMYMLPERASKLLPSLLEAKNLPLKSGRRKVIALITIQNQLICEFTDVSVVGFLPCNDSNSTRAEDILHGGHHNQEMFQLSSLDVTHAPLVNKFWHFGSNERSQTFIERCIQTFPTFCLLGPEGTPVSWSLMDQTGEIRMGGTVPEHRGKGLISYLMDVHIHALDKLDYPSYYHTALTNKIIQKMSHSLNHITLPCNWNQWHCVPL